jgi:TnpA family transposase
VINRTVFGRRSNYGGQAWPSNPTRLAQGIAEFGRIDKTLHSLRFIDDKDMRRGTLTQLNRGEGRHSVARVVFSGKRGELRQRYREGQEDQLGALGLVDRALEYNLRGGSPGAIPKGRVSGERRE